MSSIRLSNRYAKSLLDLAKDKGQLEAVHNDVLMIDETLENNQQLSLVFKSPIIKSDKKENILKAIFKDKLNPITWAFVLIMVKKGREGYLKDILKAFITQYNLYKNITPVTITTAAPADAKTIDAIVQKIKAQTGLQHVELSTVVDEALIGGFILRYEDKLFDASVSRKLEVLAQEFKVNQFEKRI